MDNDKKLQSNNSMRSRLIGAHGPNNLKQSAGGLQGMASRLKKDGGNKQQQRMIQDKYRSLREALKYSYQGAYVRKVDSDEPPVRALINPNKVKMDYDDKIISIDFQHDYHIGDVFEWIDTHSYWLIYLQDLTELAYFRGDIRKCNYQISWEDENGQHSTYAAVRGPVETKINYIQKHSISIDIPNQSLHFLIPKTEASLKYFQRYSKFYLSDMGTEVEKVCWRIEAFDAISVPGIIEVNAVEYYSNKDEDDVENGIVGGLIVKEIDIDESGQMNIISGPDYIKPKISYTYTFLGENEEDWKVDSQYVSLLSDGQSVSLKWNNNLSGEFILSKGDISKQIKVKSIF